MRQERFVKRGLSEEICQESFVWEKLIKKRLVWRIASEKVFLEMLSLKMQMLHAGEGILTQIEANIH